MALDYLLRYPGRTLIDPAYPQGKAKDESAVGAGDGTPFQEDLLNDHFGFRQALLKEATVTPSEVPDTAVASQYLDAMLKVSRGPVVVSNWTSRSPLTATQLGAVEYSTTLGLFCAVGVSVADRILTSVDGITWVSRTPGNPASGFQGIVWSASLNLFCAVGTATIETSPDGITWTTRVPAAVEDLFDVTYSASVGLFVAVGGLATVPKIQTSPDGITWTTRAPAGVVDRFRAVTFSIALGLYCAVGFNGRIETSPDGIVWTSRTAAGTPIFRGVTFSENLGLFVAVGTAIETSPDGIVWTSALAGTGLNSVSYSTDLAQFVAVGGSGEIRTSNIGTGDWVTRSSAGAANLNGVVYSTTSRVFASVGDGAQIETSLFF